MGRGSWRVRPGDTLYLIAAQSGTTIAELLRLNPGIDPNNLQVGQVINLPEELPPCPSGVYWEVAAGDTLFSIARAIGTTVERLLELNPHIDPENLQIGQKICLPG
ncbi:MAG: LysM domain-containing protein [Bacillota bacterium]|nr:LysM domain-containing protein [Bacillota bacterium]